MPEKRIGNQTPTQSLALPYEKTVGAEAIKAYEKTGRTAQEWQELLIYDMMARNEEDLSAKRGYTPGAYTSGPQSLTQRSSTTGTAGAASSLTMHLRFKETDQWIQHYF